MACVYRGHWPSEPSDYLNLRPFHERPLAWGLVLGLTPQVQLVPAPTRPSLRGFAGIPPHQSIDLVMQRERERGKEKEIIHGTRETQEARKQVLVV